jgi:hypothetical protein
LHKQAPVCAPLPDKPSGNNLFVACSVGFISAAYAQQIITERKVGEVLGEVKCGKKDPAVAIRYLNTVWVSKYKLENITPEMQVGYQSATRWC